jgi:MFS family permease
VTTHITSITHNHRPGTVRAALSYRDFRIVWLGLFASSIGTWMQNVALPAYIDARTKSGFMVGLLVFAQLGPLLLLSIPGGMLADKVPRRPLLIVLQSCQAVFAVILAFLVANDSHLLPIFMCTLGTGVANALNAPAFQASIPLLVHRDDLQGAISLNATMINGSRVIGPSIAAILAARGLTAPYLFLINAATFAFVIVALAVVTIPVVKAAGPERGWRQLLSGVAIVRRRPVLARLLVSMVLFSFFCLPYVGLFPTVARLAFGMDPEAATFKWLYATWGLGACLGALANGTVLSRIDKKRLIPVGFAAFGVFLFGFALTRSPSLAFPLGFCLGFAYFGTTTAMLTVLQNNMDDHERARVMALWFMAFGGTVPLGNLVFGPIIDRIGPRWVLAGGAVFALFLARYCDVLRMNRRWRSPFGNRPGNSFETGHAAALDEHGIATG